MRATRLWRLLTVEKRSGRPLGIDKFVKFRPPGSVAVSCLPCPYPGFNMAPDWRENVVNASVVSVLTHQHTDSLFHSYIHWKKFAMDGNFHLSKMAKNCNGKDHSIWKGSSCLNERHLIESHLKDFGTDLSEVRLYSTACYLKVSNHYLFQKSTCSKFNAVENQNRLKHRGEDITGIFSIICNHGIPEPNGSVDLQRGER